MDITAYGRRLCHKDGELVRENNPGWKPGDAFDTSILDQSFKDAIDSIIDGTDNIFKDQAAKLIREKIQLYDNLVPVCENTFSAKNQEIKQAA